MLVFVNNASCTNWTFVLAIFLSRFAIHCIWAESSNLQKPQVTQLVALYEDLGHSCYLYMVSILVNEYASETRFVQGLLSMLQVGLLLLYFTDPEKTIWSTMVSWWTAWWEQPWQPRPSTPGIHSHECLQHYRVGDCSVKGCLAINVLT